MEQYYAWFLLLAPLAATIAILLNLHRKPDYAIFASVGSASVCFLVALAVASGAIPEPKPFEWIAFPGWNVDIGMIFDPLAKGMLLIVTGVGLLIHIYSIGYMASDPSRGRFFGGLSIFMFSMTGIVVSDNLIMLFIFWEGVGFSSYLLIGFWYERESAALAANKAFVCNRLADFGFMIGILTLWLVMGTVSVRPEVVAEGYRSSSLPWVGSILTPGEVETNHLPSIPNLHGVVPASALILTIMVLGLFSGCVGKSAMFPLHVWLPDAMEGPTPVSALIHAATMVAAGVYMLCRVYPLLQLSATGMFVIAFIGCFTAIFAALIAVQQNDIKRILAYSTLSQLGYMVMAVGCGGPDAAMFHLCTHAFFKALLFLAAGSVIHALHDEQDIWKMGGLYNKIPLTFVTFAIGMLALSGVPPFAGFFSKDYLLSAAYARSPIFYWVGVITAFLTAFYMTRLVVVAFFGPPRTHAAEHPHESPKVMTIPLVLLAVLSTIGGFIGIQSFFHGWFLDVMHAMIPNGVIAPAAESGIFLEMIIPGALVLLGIGSAVYLYWGKATDPLDIEILANKFYFDEFYDRSFVGGQQRAARFLNWIDSWILDGLIIRGSAYVTFGVGEILRLFQTGSLQGYAFLFSLGGILLIYFTLFAH
ncbi:MAG TPA: NADH-quinone oxidoreductase subunit L [Candidatus Methylacidiphilales bacterium]|jgi:NADH-quinone oxidoreductase subunit L|nr:NADH-quinone oxidoreductase subunit L [Candidatus Methylacidiphilales bacterium]